jgi:biotin transport system substrate-specific component
LPTIGTMVLGSLVIYAFGLGYLMYDLGIDLETAWNIGMKNYLLGDALKILLAAGCLPAIWRGVDALHKD